MKSERRHELQHNELAAWLNKSFKAIQPHQNAILLVGSLVVLVLLGYSWWSRAADSQSALAWDELNDAVSSQNVTMLTEVAEKYPGTRAGLAAAVVAADYRLSAGCNQLFVNKASARQEISKATELYSLVRDQSRVPSLVERATFGLARAKEATAEADGIETAKRLYAEIVERWPAGAYTAVARQRIADLNRTDTKRMYDDFAKFDPKPAFSGDTSLPGQAPQFDKGDLPAEDSLDASDPLNRPQPNGAGQEGSAAPRENEKPAAPAETTGEPSKSTEKDQPAPSNPS